MEYIKNNVLNSKLVEMFDLSSIDWLKCHEFACSSLVKITCDLWNSGIKNTTKIGEILKLSSTTISKYLSKANILNWCDYDPKKSFTKNAMKAQKSRKIPVVQLDLNGKYIREFDSATDAEREYKYLNATCITNCCKGNQLKHKGFEWIYKKDFIMM